MMSHVFMVPVARKIVYVSFLFVLYLIAGVAAGFGQDCTDSRVKEGIRLYDKEVNFDRAIQELKQAIKRLQDGPREGATRACVHEAYLYMGMAYVGIGQDARARESFRDAAKASLCGPLNEDDFNPRALSLYKEECLAMSPTITVKSNLPNAEVFLDEARKGKAPVELLDIPPGPHVVKVTYGTQSREQTFRVEPGQRLEIKVEFDLVGHLSVSSEPSGASIELDGQRAIAQTPSLIRNCTAGEHTLQVSKEGYRPRIEMVNVKPDEVTSVRISLEPLTYRVTIASVPPGADLFWDDVQVTKTTPVVMENVPAGVHKIRLTRENHEEYLDTLEVRDVPVERTFFLKEYTGTVLIESDPSGAEVSVEGKYEGTTPFRQRYSAGKYALRLRKEGFLERQTVFEIIRNKETALSEPLVMIDTQRPEIVFEPLTKTIKENKYHVKATATDNLAMGSVSLKFRLEGETEFREARMTVTEKDTYQTAIPEVYLRKDTAIEYFVVACDAQDNCTRSGGETAPYKLKITSLEPYTEGYVLDIDRNRRAVSISVGSLDGIARQDRLYVFRRGRQHIDPKTGDVLGIEEELVGVLKVNEVSPRMASAVIEEEFSKASSPIRSHDRVRKRSGTPTNLRSEGMYADRVLLRWAANPEPEVKGYTVFRSSTIGGTYEVVGEVNGRDNTAYEDRKDMVEGLTYYYRVAAVNRLGTPSILSEPLPCRTKMPLSPPEIVTGRHRAIREIVLTWDASKADPDLDNYVVFRASSEQGEFVQVARLDRNSSTFVDKGNHLADGKAYFYRVASRSVHGTLGPMSSAKSVMTRGGPPPPPRIKPHNGLIKQAKITWEKDKEDEKASGYSVAYNIYKKEREDSEFDFMRRTDDTSYSEGQLEHDQKYYYCIQSFYRYQGLEIRGECSKPIIVETRRRPRTPTGFVAEGGLPKKVVLKWDPTSDKDVRYWIQKKLVQGEGLLSGIINVFANQFKVSPEAGRYVDSNLDDGKEYSYTIKATDIDGLESVTVDATARTKPAPAVPVGVKARLNTDKAVLTWEPNPEKDVTGYKVCRKASFLASDDCLVTKETSLEMPVPEGARIEFLVKALDSDNLESAYSAPAEVERKKPQP